MITRLKNNKKLTRMLVLAIIACVLLGGFGMAIAAEGTPSNIAKTSSIYAEVTDPFWESNGYGTSALVDGTTDSKYFSTEDHTTPDVTKELYFTFNNTYKVSSIKLVSTSNRSIPKDFTISVWNGNNWVEVANEKDTSVSYGAAYTKDGLAQTCTGIRIRATKLSVGSSASQYAMRFAEIEIMGVESNTKLANPIVHTMNVVQGISDDKIQFDCPNWAAVDFPKTKLVDGNTTDHKNFSTTADLTENAEKEIYLTLDGTYQMNEVVLYPALQIISGTKQYVGGFPADFTVSIWDGNEWKEVARKTGASVGAVGTAVENVKPISFEFPAVEGNTVRINVTKQGALNTAGTQFALRLAEIEVNGVKSAKIGVETPNIVFEAKNIAKDADVDGATYVFDKTYKVNEVIINKADFPKAFEVSVWDGTAWQKVASKKSADVANGGVYLTFDPVDCRAIRITSDSTIPELNKDANEIVIHGVDTSAFVNVPTPLENAALGATVEMECPDWATATLGPAQLVDGNITNFTTTAYATDAATAKTAKVTFSGAYEVSKVNLYPRLSGANYKADGGFPVAFKVLVWDGEVWKEVKSVTEATTFSGQYPMLSLTLDSAVVCNGIKIEATTLGVSDNANLPYVLQLAELEVLGKKSDKTLNEPDYEEVPEYTGVNATLNGTVEMKVAAFATESFPKENLVDGTSKFTTTTYATVANTEESAVVIFKEGSYTIDKIVLSPRVANGKVVGFPEDFKISVWNGSKWVEVASKTGCTSDGTNLELAITPTLCNAVKIDVTKMGASDNAAVPYTFQLAEFEAWGQKDVASLAKPPVEESGGNTETETQDGTNAALNGTVTMNIPKWATSFPGSKMVDGATKGDSNFATTEYVSDAGTKESVIVAFKDGAYEIDNIKLYPRVKGTAYNGGFPVDFTVSVWNGAKWVEVAKKTGVAKNTVNPVSLDITPIVCNALKIDVTKMGESENKGKFTLQLAEIQAFGEKSSKTLAAPPTSANTTVDGNGSTVTIDNDKNLALYRPVKASSDLSQYNAPVTKVNDGSINTYWASDDRKFVKGEAQWAEVNLLNNYSIHTVILGARQEALGFPNDFKVEVFYDGEWIEAYSIKGFEANEKTGYTAYEFKFPAVIGNKVRVSSDNFRKVGTSNSMVLSEIAVYGDSVSGNYVLPNENMITAGAAVTATTSMEDYDYYIKHLVDGNLSTGWSSVPQTTADSVQEVEIDMKGEVQLSEIQLKPSWGGHGFPIDFTISVFENGKWTQVYEAKDYEKPEDEAIQRFQFETKKVSKFKITVTKLAEEAGLYVWKMNEIMAYPSHTGDEFDPNRVEEVNSSEKLVAAEVITQGEDTNDMFVDVQLWKIIVGGILFLVALGGCVAVLIASKKKNK